MITNREKNALQLAKRVFEHFTHDSLPLAREILAMERELGQLSIFRNHVNGIPDSIPQVKKTDVDDFSNSALFAIGIEDYTDPAQPVKQLNPELVSLAEDDLPF